MADSSDSLLADRFQTLVANNKLYLDSTITLDAVAALLNVNRVYLSQAINQCLNKSFVTYINENRIEKAIRLMKDKDKPELSIESIAYQSGFNDRKSFYRVFRRTTGYSPSDYRKNIKN